MRIKSKKLSHYFIYSVIASFVVSVLIWFITCLAATFFLYLDDVQKLIMSDQGVTVIFISYGISLILIVSIFILVFIRLIDPKIKYIKYISEQIQRIENEGIGTRVEEIGDDELTQLSRSINSMSSQLKEKIENEKRNDKVSRELITNVSHDLRTPLTSIIGYVDLLKKNGFKDEAKFNEYVEVVERRIDGLNIMINELFEYTKLDSTNQPLELHEIDIIPLIRHLIKEYSILYNKLNLELIDHIEIDSFVVDIDYNKMIRVFQNLFDNAKKYSKKDTPVNVRIYSENNSFCFELKNYVESGLSLDIKRISDRFYIGDTSRTNAESSGLGLAIVKRIVELHKGNLKIDYHKDEIRFLIQLNQAIH